MASKLGRIVLVLLLFVGISRPVFASEFASVTILGAEQSANGVWDTGTITVTVNGHSETVSYGQFSTPASIASALGVQFSKNCGCHGGPACAKGNGAEILFKAKNGAAIVSLSGSSGSNAGFASPSFRVDTSRGQGGSPHINSLSPASGKVGSQVIISGSGFGSAGSGVNLVTFNGTVASTSSWSDTSIAATVPDVAATGDVIVTMNGTASNGVTFTVTSDEASSPILSGTLYSYTGPSYDGAGNVTGFTDSVTGQWTAIGYDSLNRLSAAQVGSGPYLSQGPYMCWTYDWFGNRESESLSSTPCSGSPAPTTWANYNSNNQVTGTTQAPGGYVYDAAGNVTSDGQNQYAYDGEGRLCAVYNGFDGSYTQYLYDGDGNRVAKGAINSLSCDSNSNGFTLLIRYIVGQSGEQLSEVDGAGTWLHSNAYANGQLLGTYDVSGFHYHLSDPLGTKRMQVLADLSAYEACGSLPFGNSLNYYGPASNTDTGTDNEATEHHFTGKERDTESGNDYFGARYYSSSMGRFMSPDPLGPWAADVNEPQSWNFYAYARNNPLINIDPTGLDCVYFNDAGTGVDRDKDGNVTGIDHNSNSAECEKNGGNWANGTVDPNNVISNGKGGFNVSSSDGRNVYDTTMTAPDSRDNPNGTCFGNCVSDYSQQNLGVVTSMIVAGNLSDFMHWLPMNGTPGHPGAQIPLPLLIRIGNNHYCGPNGAGVPGSNNDWACAVHDYNYNKLRAGPWASWIGVNSKSAVGNAVLKDANKALVNGVDNSPEGLIIKTYFSIGRY